MNTKKKIVVTEAARLVGKNLLPRLKLDRWDEIVAIDKHSKNLAILRQLHPELRVVEADLAEPGAWQAELEGCTHLAVLRAQIGGRYHEEFVHPRIRLQQHPYAVNISM